MCPAKAGSPLPAAERSFKPHYAPAARRGRRARLLEARRVRALAARRAAGGERASSYPRPGCTAAEPSGRWCPGAPRAASAPRRIRDQAVLRPSQAGAGGPTRRGRRARLVVSETRLYCGRAKLAVVPRSAAGGERASS
eukprot:tig00001479_g8907.t1